MAQGFQLFTSLRCDPLLISLPTNTEHGDPEAKDSIPYYMLRYHRDRLIEAAQEFEWKIAADILSGSGGLNQLLARLDDACSAKTEHPMRVKVLLSENGSITIETGPATKVSQWNLYPARLPPPRSAAKTVVSPLTGGALDFGEDDTVHGDPPKDEPWEVIPDTTPTTPSAYTSFKTTNRDMYDAARKRAGIETMTEKREVLIISDKDDRIMEGSLTTPYLWRKGIWTTPPLASGGQAGTTRRWALEKGLCVEGEVRADDLVDGEDCWLSNGVRGFLRGKIKFSR